MHIKNNLENDMPIFEVPYPDLCKLGFFDYKKAQLTIIWGDKVSKNQQIILLRKVYPKLKKLSSAQIHKIACQNGQQWILAEMGWGNAVDIKDEASRLGLNIVVKEIK